MLWSGSARNSTITVPGLKHHTAIAVCFSVEDMSCVVSTADGKKRVGAAHSNGYSLVGVGGSFAVSENAVTIDGVTFGIFDCDALDSPLKFSAGDAAYVTAIYGL